MELLLILVICIVILSILSIIGLYIPKNKIVNQISFIGAIILTLVIGYLCFTSLPSNFIFKKIITVLLSILPFVALGFFFAKMIKFPILKLCIAGILILNNIYFIYNFI